MSKSKTAPGSPGIPARWTSSAKSGVGTSFNKSSEVSFTLSHGIVNEVYFPREDSAWIRDMGLIVTDGKEFFSEEKRDTEHEVKTVGDGVPAYILTNTCEDKRYRITKEIITDTRRDTLLQRVTFEALKGKVGDYHLCVLLAPHIDNKGAENDAWLGDFKGIPMLYAQRNNRCIALACSVPWKRRSVGYVGTSDGYTDLHSHKQITWEYEEAPSGNVALTAEIDLEQVDKDFVLAVGFGRNPTEAGHRAYASIVEGFDRIQERYVRFWQNWQESLITLTSPKDKIGELARMSAAMLRIHESKRFPGGIIASFSIPWGYSKGDGDIGGYHLVWPRDLVESSGGLIALGAKKTASRVLEYLLITQEKDGHWSQNMWLEGIPFWTGIQLDEVALPILLIEICRRHEALDPEGTPHYWQMVKKAVIFLVKNGPDTEQDRWEEVGGWTPFTLAAEVAALVAAAEFADENGESDMAEYCRQTADRWNESIDRLTYVTGTPLAKKVGVEGYYLRVNPSGVDAQELADECIKLKNQPDELADILVTELVSVDALALVRFGLRAADDPKILNTIKVIDEVLKVETPTGPCWYRYNRDGYGEHEDGSPFDGTDVGRAWPLLTGERAHYEIAAGNLKGAKKLMETMETFASHGLFPEQIWDKDDIPEKELFFGKHAGSAMPLVWAHSEYIKLCCSIREKRVFDMPKPAWERYVKKKTPSKIAAWRFDQRITTMPKGKTLRIETFAPAKIHWTQDAWETQKTTPTRDTGLGIYVADLPTTKLEKGRIDFTLLWEKTDNWEGRDFSVLIV